MLVGGGHSDRHLPNEEDGCVYGDCEIIRGEMLQISIDMEKLHVMEKKRAGQRSHPSRQRREIREMVRHRMEQMKLQPDDYRIIAIN